MIESKRGIRGAGVRLLVALPALLALQCNMVFGIDEAELTESDAASAGSGGSGGGSSGSGGASASGGTGGGAEAGLLCESTEELCWDCTSSQCCTAYEACATDATCMSALASYNDCLEANPADGTGCAEASSVTSNRFFSLSQCVFLDQCIDECKNYPLGNLCEPYCACMDDTCSDKIVDKDTCLEQCAQLTLEQIRCRSRHCTFAENDPGTHCPHAAGEAVCP